MVSDGAVVLLAVIAGGVAGGVLASKLSTESAKKDSSAPGTSSISRTSLSLADATSSASAISSETPVAADGATRPFKADSWYYFQYDYFTERDALAGKGSAKQGSDLYLDPGYDLRRYHNHYWQLQPVTPSWPNSSEGNPLQDRLGAYFLYNRAVGPKYRLATIAVPELITTGAEIQVQFKATNSSDVKQYWYFRSVDESAYRVLKNMATGDNYTLVYDSSWKSPQMSRQDSSSVSAKSTSFLIYAGGGVGTEEEVDGETWRISYREAMVQSSKMLIASVYRNALTLEQCW